MIETVMMHRTRMAMAVLSMLAASGANAEQSKSDERVFPVAVFAFHERAEQVQGLGQQIADLVVAQLASDPRIYLVDRRELQDTLDELELGLTGLADHRSASRVGHLTGAKILVTGSILQVESKRILVGQVIGTETSRVYAVTAKGDTDDDFVGLAERLAKQVGKTILTQADQLVAPADDEKRMAKAIQEQLGPRRPSLRIKVTESHVGQPIPDPAAQTELEHLCIELGFTVLAEPDAAADVLITGEGFSEFAGRHGNLITTKARLELKAVDGESRALLFSDRQTTIGVDLAERMAAKSALQQAAAQLAERLLPKLTK